MKNHDQKQSKNQIPNSNLYSLFENLGFTNLPKIIRKKHEGKKLSAEEKHKFNRAWKVASLVENFGKLAITVISGYGVGADTAARILRNMVDEEIIFKQIYEAERQYVITRGFWDS